MQLATRRSIRYVVRLIAVLATCAGSSAAASGSSGSGSANARILVKFRSGTPRWKAAHLLSTAGAQSLRVSSKLGVHVVTVGSGSCCFVVARERNESPEGALGGLSTTTWTRTGDLLGAITAKAVVMLRHPSPFGSVTPFPSRRLRHGLSFFAVALTKT